MSDQGQVLPVTIIVPGKAVPKGRPRFVRGRSKPFTPPRTRAWSNTIGWSARDAWREPPVGGPVEVDIKYNYAGSPPRGDLDNLDKCVLDALNGIVWVDDRQVKSKISRFVASTFDRVEVTIRSKGAPA